MKYLIYVFSILILGSCTTRLETKEYVEYVRNPKNGLVIRNSFGDMVVEIQYEPSDYLALKELRGIKLNDAEFAKVKERFQDYIYFKTEIYSNRGMLFGSIDSLTKESYDSQLKFHFNDYAYLVNCSDTLKCLMSQYDNTGGVGDRYSFEMIFEKKELLSDSLKFHFQDKLMRTGIEDFNFSISTDAIKNIPDFKI